MNFLLVFILGGIGSVLRYAVGLVLPASFFPWCTLLVNVLGCFAIGVFGGLAVRFGWSESARLAIMVGLCGGFTTFSTFSKDALSVAASGRWNVFVLYVIGSVVLGLGAVTLGLFCSRLMQRICA